MKEHVNQHKIPRFYLNKFANKKSGKLCVLYKQSNNIIYEPSKNIAVEENFFNLDGIEEAAEYYSLNKDEYYKEHGIKLDKLVMEKDLQQKESEAARIIKLIHLRGSFNLLTRGDVEFLLDWAAWLYVVNEGTILKHANNFEYSNTQKVKFLIERHGEIVPAFRNKTWMLGFIKNLDKFLISSDCPVSLVSEESLSNSVQLEKAIVYFPLSPEILLMGRPNSKNAFQVNFSKELPKEVILMANIVSYAKANKILLAREINDFKYLFEF